MQIIEAPTVFFLRLGDHIDFAVQIKAGVGLFRTGVPGRHLQAERQGLGFVEA